MNKRNYKDYKENIFQEVAKQVAGFSQAPTLAIIGVNPDDASQIYMRNKKNACEKSGIRCVHHVLQDASLEEVEALIQKLNQDKNTSAIILQLPLPAHLKAHEDALTQKIALEKDVDGFTIHNLGATFLGKDSIVGCTPAGVMEIFQDHYGSLEALAGKTVVVVGRGFLVGKPLVNLLMNRQATVISVNSKTKNPKELCKSADAVVLATDQLDFFDASYFSPGQLLVDVGIGHSPKTGTMCGCLELSSLESVDLTAVVSPGGVGQLTQAMLMKNVLALHKNQGKA